MVLFLAVCLLFTACGSTGEKEVSRSNISASGNSRGNRMTAEVNRSKYTLQLEKAEIFNGTEIRASYVALDPRGDVMFQIVLYLDKDIAPGHHDSDIDWANHQARQARSNVYLGTSFYSRAMKVYVYDSSSGAYQTNTDDGGYTLELTSRSSDWMTYEGTFSALATKRDLGVTIENASFSFTITR